MDSEAEIARLMADGGQVGRDPGFLAWAAPPGQGSAALALALVATDMVGSTALLFEVGDDAYDLILAGHFARARELLAEHGGREINTAGDSYLCAFHDTGAAVRFAAGLAAAPGSDRVKIRAAVHHGVVKARNSDLCGQQVHFVCRVMSQSPGPGLWLSDAAAGGLRGSDPELVSRLRLTEHPGRDLKDIPGKHTLWQVTPPG